MNVHKPDQDDDKTHSGEIIYAAIRASGRPGHLFEHVLPCTWWFLQSCLTTSLITTWQPRRVCACSMIPQCARFAVI